jgi:primosomal protein N' (replication factor Y)
MPPSPPSPPPAYAEVAVPVPLDYALVYRVPAHLGPVEPGCRVRVPVGRREHVGVVVGVREKAPEGGYEIRELAAVLDLQPVLTPDLLELARFVADYYLTPIGEVPRMMLPGSLPPWGDRRVSLTNAGALAPPRDAGEERLVAALLAGPGQRLADLQRTLRLPDLGARVEALRQLGRLSVEEPGARRGARYVTAVDLAPGELDGHLAACGRSPHGRAVVEVLDALGRPATLRELTAAVGCGASVVRRLVKLRILRQFTQPERLSLARHRLSSAGGEPPRWELRPDQRAAVTALTAALAAGGVAAVRLRGMTGSGKTEVYLRAVERTLELGRSAILLVPEIALVPALARHAVERFGRDLAILHSNLSSGEREQEWERLRRGEARIVLGPRSALFAPLASVGLVIVDEEHDAAYKQDQTPRYNGRDLALWRARAAGAVAVLVSATPSMESRHNVAAGKLAALALTARVGRAELPAGILVDLRDERVELRPGEVCFSQRLLAEIRAALDAGDQVILLRNRRGYSPILLCRACGEDFRCPDCGLPFTFHRRARRLMCHYCGRERGVPPVCPQCQEPALDPIGAGTERVEEQFKELFPDVPVDVLDADATRRAGGAAAVLERFAAGRSQVLIGTQMVSKGHHFPRVSLAAVLDADTYLGFPDFRAVERTYALLTQLAGRAGRGERPGKVVIQTFHPRHYAIRAVLENDDETFVREEMRFRRSFHYPPFTRMVQLLVRHKDRAKAEGQLREIAARLLAHPLAHGVLVAGPALAPLERLRGKWRYQLLLRSASGGRLRRLVREAVDVPSSVDLVVDVDPYALM